MSAMDLSAGREYEQILEYINQAITPHLKKTLRAVGEIRPDNPIAFIAECFVSGQIPDTSEHRGAAPEQSLSAYIGEHQVVALVQQAVGICAAAQPPPENPLLVVGQYLQGNQAAPPVEPPSVAPPPEAQAWDEDDTPTDTLWVGRIPLNLVGGTRSMQSVLNINANKNISSLFSKFGTVKHSTVRVKPGENKSWALITFESAEAAAQAKAEGVVVLDEKYEEISLRVEFSDVEGQLALNPSGGQLAQVSRTHSEVVSGELADSDTVWIGGIPHDVIGQDEGGASLSAELLGQLGAYGELISHTVRVKEGAAKSWALVTFQDPASCQRCVEGGLYLPDSFDDTGARAMLRINRYDVEGQTARGRGQGALQHMAQRHEEEVEAARALMRQMWADASAGGGMTTSGDGGSGGVERKLARYKAFDSDRASAASTA